MAVARALLRTAGGQLMRQGSRPVHRTAALDKLVQFNLSDIGEGIREVTVKSWYVKENDVVSQFDEVCEVESDKATVSITSRFDGRVTKLYHGVGDTALVGQPLLDIDVEDSQDADEEGKFDLPSAPVDETVPTPTSEDGEDSYSAKSWNKSLATPAVRRIAMENKIKLSDVKGTGKQGRVLKEDILAYVDNMTSGSESAEANIVSLSAVQKVMIRTMTESLKIPQFGLCDQIDVSKLVQVRIDAKEVAAKKDIKLSYLPFFIKAVSKGLSEYPILNSSFDEEQGKIVYKKCHNIGIAVDSPVGLLVPNIKNVQNLSIIGIAKELNRLQDLASKMKLLPADMTGGTFSVSNIGAIAGTTAAPVVLPPEVAILAIGRIQRLPRFDPAGSVFPADIISISWSADHRIIDGATVARCSQVFKYFLENPSALLLDV